MCTLVLLRDVHPRFPFVLAANRDELYARAASLPAVLCERPRVVGGRDLEAGGTWMGVAATGLLAGLTNQRTGRAPDRSRRSRGAVVLDALRCGTLEGAIELVAGLDPREFNAFNLLLADAGRAVVAYARDEVPGIRIEDVPPGVHVLPNDRLDAQGWPKVERALRAARPLAARAWPDVLSCVPALLGDHTAEPSPFVVPEPREPWLTPGVLRALDALCIHTPVYGTRSASIVALEPGRVAAYHFADGAPCVTPFVDVLPLVQS